MSAVSAIAAVAAGTIVLDPDVVARMRYISSLPETADRVLAILEADRREKDAGERAGDDEAA